MKSPLLRLSQNGRTIGIRADAIVAVTTPTEGRTGSIVHLNTHGPPHTIAVSEEAEAVMAAIDESLGFSRTPIKPPGQR